ncbi:MAG: terpene cyclase/mutase family protein [Phycisphaerales bacterium]|nr:terpene cyclase/mutase family protein [Phycisphaerales bacterium]
MRAEVRAAVRRPEISAAHGAALRSALCAALCAGLFPMCLANAQDSAAPPAAPPSAAEGESVEALLPEAPREVTPATRTAIEKGLRYLAQTQNRDGSWRTSGGSGGYPTAMTALAGMALLAGGNTPTQGLYARNVSSALTFLLRGARRDGLIAQEEELAHCMHGHGFATLFLAQCLGVEEDAQRQGQLRLALQRAVELTGRSQSAAGGWLYTPTAQADEGSVTVTQVQALRACRNAGIAVPKKVIDSAMKYLDKSQNDDGGIRYQYSDSGPSRPAITAAAVMCWFNAGIYDEPNVVKALRFCERSLAPGTTPEGMFFGHYFYAHLYMSQVMYLAGEEKWRQYYPAIRDILLRKQADDGSWDGDHVGTTYGTAVALVILQIPYKHLPIVQR